MLFPIGFLPVEAGGVSGCRHFFRAGRKKSAGSTGKKRQDFDAIQDGGTPRAHRTAFPYAAAPYRPPWEKCRHDPHAQR
ncbi:hypothetical protein [Thioalkalivibrio sp. ALgr3]|uniref:hypothetical protein n=1 Tax=Thioalkalivibrio sp. ALgr3 TaxID=1239292 RepID=UPI0012DC5911|nr:hypothetical protein [Thioalkalivibrio sp. ALgr3]